MKEEFFTRAVAEIIDRPSFEKRLKSGRKLRVKLGVDPTRPDIHLGHAVALRKLAELQNAGHRIIFLIGDYTAKIGDPSGRSKTRPILDDREIKNNAKTYLDQADKIFNLAKTEIRYNSEWFSRMNFSDILSLVGKFSVAQILERDDFEQRLKSGADLGINEILYPIMQAYDSVMLKADVELGGSDQKFNLLTGRDLQRKIGLEPQDIMTVRLLTGLDGKNKMSKSLDNYVGVIEPAAEQFGKIMSIPDSLILEYFELCTDVPAEEIKKIQRSLVSGENPKILKEKLAEEVVKIYHNSAKATKAREEFNLRFRDKKLPSDIPEIKVPVGNYEILLLLMKIYENTSRSDLQRLVEQGGVKIDGVRLGDPRAVLAIHPGMIIEIGKRKIYRLR